MCQFALVDSCFIYFGPSVLSSAAWGWGGVGLNPTFPNRILRILPAIYRRWHTQKGVFMWSLWLFFKIFLNCFDRYKSSLVFVVKPFAECVQEDSVRLSPKMDELTEFTEAMETFLRNTGIPYTAIDVLDLQTRVEIVKAKLKEKKDLLSKM